MLACSHAYAHMSTRPHAAAPVAPSHCRPHSHCLPTSPCLPLTAGGPPFPLHLLATADPRGPAHGRGLKARCSARRGRVFAGGAIHVGAGACHDCESGRVSRAVVVKVAEFHGQWLLRWPSFMGSGCEGGRVSWAVVVKVAEFHGQWL
eukprot:360101-Chlamydomonas_euryale.AAC.2